MSSTDALSEISKNCNVFRYSACVLSDTNGRSSALAMVVRSNKKAEQKHKIRMVKILSLEQIHFVLEKFSNSII
ncbi:MAG: hypothetical protein ACRBDL_02105 [Alphaproteobacteria bacterium]